MVHQTSLQGSGHSAQASGLEEDRGDASAVQGEGHSAAGLRMEVAVLRAEVAEMHARECLQRMETQAMNPGNFPPSASQFASSQNSRQQNARLA